MANNYVKVKICGICDLKAAKAAVDAGADALGFVFAPSRRRISPDDAREIIKKLPPFVSRVGVFVDPTLEEVIDTAGYAGLDTIQLHGDEPPEFCRRIPYQVIKSFAVSGKPDPGLMGRYRVDAYLLDTQVPGSRGGTGRTFDWRLASGLRVGPLIVAGGLTPENVQEAVKAFRPYAVDVSSGVESGGRKDIKKITDFIRRVKG
ncbi:MAG: phosphoribosylanthranilate isomerase [Bacillota bacterium]